MDYLQSNWALVVVPDVIDYVITWFVPTVTNLKCYDLLALCNLSFLLISWDVNNYYFTCINLGYHLHNLSKTVSKKNIIHATHTQCSRYMYILPSLINLTPLSNLNLHVHWFREGGRSNVTNNCHPRKYSSKTYHLSIRIYVPFFIPCREPVLHVCDNTESVKTSVRHLSWLV